MQSDKAELGPPDASWRKRERLYASHLQEILASHAAVTGRSFGVTDRHFCTLAHAHGARDQAFDVVASSSILKGRAEETVIAWLDSIGIASAAQPVRVPANPDLDMDARICVPVQFNGLRLGYMWMYDSDASAGCILDDALRVASEVGAELYRLRILESEARDHEAELLRSLTLPAGAEVLREVERLLTRSARYVAVVVDVKAKELVHPDRARAYTAAAIHDVRRSRAPGDVLAASVDGRGLLVLAALDDVDDEGHGVALLDAARHTLDVDEVRIGVGVGAPVHEVADLHRSFAQAHQAAQLALADTGDHVVVAWGSLGADRMILGLLGSRDGTEFVPRGIERLLQARDARQLVETLNEYLEAAGDAQSAAQRLFIHRSTLYQRLHRIEKITASDLTRGDDRLALHLGLRLLRLARASSRSRDSDVVPAQSELSS